MAMNIAHTMAAPATCAADRLALGLGIAGMLAGLLFAIQGQAQWVAACVSLAVGASLWAGRGLVERRRLRRLLTDVQQRHEAVPAVLGGRSELDHVRSTLDYLGRALGEQMTKTEAQLAFRRRIETDLKASEERYALALQGADEGLWEWDLKTGQVHYSERWRSMLGLTSEEAGSSIEAWCERIHPSDRARVRSELDAHLEGHVARFESEHRVMHTDGRYRWILARATALRHANGKPQRLIGLATDITPRKEIQQAVLDLADSLGGSQGEDCLKGLVRRFAQVLGVSEVFVCECVDFPTTQVRMLARWRAGTFASCVAFDLEGTACAEVIAAGRLVYAPVDAGVRWPMEKRYDRNSYLGMPCLDSQGRVIGHIACADPGSMPQMLPHEALLKIFAVRVAIELERRSLQQGNAFPCAVPAPQMTVH